MISALLHGKLSREQENMEDILVASVFDLIRYRPAVTALLPWLALAHSPSGTRPLSCFRAESEAQATYEPWPLMNERGSRPCEPDILIRLDVSGTRRYLIVVEAKYHSGKSSMPTQSPYHLSDQLAVEWDNTVKMSIRERRTPLLIYVTADLAIPLIDIKKSMQDYVENQEEPFADPCMLWLNWQALSQCFPNSSDALLVDLARLGQWVSLSDAGANRGFSTIRKDSGSMDIRFGQKLPLVQEIVKRTRLTRFDRERSGYSKLMGKITSAELFPHEDGVILVLAEGSQDLTVGRRIRNLRELPIESLLGTSGSNNSWLLGNGKNKTHAVASAYLIPKGLEKHPKDQLWHEVEALLEHARKYAQQIP